MGQGTGQGTGTGGFKGGGSPPPEATDGETAGTPEKLRGQNHGGRMIGSFLVKGDPPAGEARAELRAVLEAGTRYAEQALERERIPAELKEIPKRYFERILEP